MPIVVDSVSVPNYLAFLDSFLESDNVTPFLNFKFNLNFKNLMENTGILISNLGSKNIDTTKNENILTKNIINP
jgi:hypothetical protein